MPRKRGLYGTSPPSANDRYAMDWATALQGFYEKHGRNLSLQESEVMHGYPWGRLSIAGLWSWRGKIWAKYAGGYPTPEEMGMDADHTFFNPDYVCHGTTRNSDGKILKEEFTHHGRVIKPTHRLWSKRFDG